MIFMTLNVITVTYIIMNLSQIMKKVEIMTTIHNCDIQSRNSEIKRLK